MLWMLPLGGSASPKAAPHRAGRLMFERGAYGGTRRNSYLPNQSMPLTRVERVAIRLAEQLGFEWVDLELVKEPAGRFLRFYVDLLGGRTDYQRQGGRGFG